MPKNEAPNNKQSLPANQENKRKKSKGYSRRKGVTGEQEFVLKFKELFDFHHCKTSRNASKLLDDSKVDLAMIPLNVQIKCGYWTNRPKFEIIFKEMKAHLDSNYPPGDPQRDHPKVLIHKLDGHQHEHMGVTMMFKDWAKIYQGYLKWEAFSKSKPSPEVVLNIAKNKPNDSRQSRKGNKGPELRSI